MSIEYINYQHYLAQLNTNLPFDTPLVGCPNHKNGASVPLKHLTIAEFICVIGKDDIVRVLDSCAGAYQEKPFIELTKDWHTRGDDRKTMSYCEISLVGTCLDEKIELPSLVKQLSLVELFWPVFKPIKKKMPKLDSFIPPQNKFCVFQQKDSHLVCQMAPGGSSTWLHMLHGHQTYELYEPTNHNLLEYKLFTGSGGALDRNITKISFCNDDTIEMDTEFENFDSTTEDYCHEFRAEPGTKLTVCLEQGMLLIIPTGWIYSVKADEDSTLIGGRFLHYKDLEFQLECYELQNERRNFKRLDCDISICYGFPSLRLIYWYTVMAIGQKSRSMSNSHRNVTLVNGPQLEIELKSFRYPRWPMRRLLKHLEEWLKLHNNCRDNRRNCYAPDGVELSRLISYLKTFL